MNNTSYLHSAFTNSTPKNIEALLDYLQKIAGKTLTSICIRQNVFKTRWTKRDARLISRCHVQSAALYLSSLRTSCSNDQIRTLVVDVAQYVKQLDVNEDADFIVVSTNTLPSATHFMVARQLFYNHQIEGQNQNNYGSDLLTIYSLRLSLESRVRGFLGIDYATIKRKSVGLATLIKVSKNLKSVNYSPDFTWSEVEWINDWLNHYMHRNIRPCPWVIHQAIEALQPLLDPKKPILLEGKTVHSFYSATYVRNEIELEKEIAEALKSEYPEIEIKWHVQREILKP